uniref:Uncharacterized protein n=1 Tax=Pseudonaja textilis TaxID=8673 RepID=A0A670Z027_PSETE
MTEVEPVLDFASSGRTGRRNALPDILGSPAGVTSCLDNCNGLYVGLPPCNQGWDSAGYSGSVEPVALKSSRHRTSSILTPVCVRNS